MFDIATIYPTTFLRSHYMIQTYSDAGQLYNDSEFGVLAVEDSTQVSIHTPLGESHHFSLMAGDVRFFGNRDNYPGIPLTGLLTGTTVDADDGKKLAVFQGNECTNVGNSTCDHLYEQAVPTNYWGHEFIVVPIAGRVSDDVVKITSLEDSCRVFICDSSVALLNSGESYITSRRNTYKIYTTKPTTVCMYMSGDTDTTRYIGDPSAVIIPPLEQFTQHSTFKAINTELSHIHYANIVAQNFGLDSLCLDGEPISSAFTPYDNFYSYTQLSLTSGVHTLSNNKGLFNAWFYGMGMTESYAYLAGMAMEDPYTPNFVIEQETDCYSHTYRLAIRKNDTLEWKAMKWTTVPDDPMLQGHENDTVIYISPLVSTIYTLRIETSDYSIDTNIRLDPVVWPVASIKVLPPMVVTSNGTSFDAYDISQHSTGREWRIDGTRQREESARLHYDIVLPADSITIGLTAYNEYCVDTTAVTVRVINDNIFAPNVFTPDEESNKRFVIIATRPIEGELTIFNREGLQVFSTTDLDNGWDGHSCPQSTYVWHLRYRFDFEDNPRSAVGTVTLLR